MSSTTIKVAMITGGASGMGRVMALRLAQQGTKVAVVDLNRPMLAEVEALTPNIRAIACDVTDPAAMANVACQVETDLGPIDRLVASAGIMPALSIAAMDTGKFAQVMRVNYEGTVNTVKAALPGMLRRGRGEIVLFGSIAGVVYVKNFAAYNASKAAVNAFSEVLAHELAGSGVKVLSVRPSAVRTPLIAQATGEGGVAALRKVDSGGRMTSPEEIVEAVEKALRKNVTVLYPTAEAWAAQLLRRISPALTWRLSNAAQ